MRKLKDEGQSGKAELGLTCVTVKADLVSVENNAEVGEDALHGLGCSGVQPTNSRNGEENDVKCGISEARCTAGRD